MPNVTISKSVGRRGVNLAPDVAAIAAALVAVGPERGGIFGPPLSVEGLGQAIESFQTFQRLPARDGRVDPGGATLARINLVLNGGAVPPPPTPPPSGTGELRPMRGAGDLASRVEAVTWTPVESSLVREMVFSWTGVSGGGRIHYFELDENVVPRWFGVLVPDGTADFRRVHLFFHPTPSQAGYKDAQYAGLANWGGIFHYLTDSMGSQFCAAGTGRVLIMPLMTQGAASTCGMLPRRWEPLFGAMLARVAAGDPARVVPPLPVLDVLVSSFSSGITYSNAFRSAAGLGSRLSGVIDFDGGISSYRHLSAAIRTPPGRVVRMQQMPCTQATLAPLAAQGVFPLPLQRWGGPYENLFPKNAAQALLQVHGTIPQTMMFIAASRLR